MSKVNIAEKFAKITDYYKPRIAAELNGQHVKFVKLNSEFVFHHHENEDEMFLVVRGRFRLDFCDRPEWMEKGMCIVLFEPATTLNTGNVENELTVHELERA